MKASDLQGGASAHTYKHSSSDDLCDVNPVLYDDAIVVLHRRRAPGAEDGSGVSHHCCGADRGTGRHYIYGDRTRLKCIKYLKFSLLSPGNYVKKGLGMTAKPLAGISLMTV